MIEAIRQEVLLALAHDGEVEAEVKSQVDELLVDWAREAGDEPPRDRILDILRDDLLSQLQGQPAAAQRQVLRAELADRHLRALSQLSLAAARQRLHRQLPPAQAAAQGDRLLEALQPVVQEVSDLPDGDRKRELERGIQEVSLEALYCKDGHVMSQRLHHEAQATSGQAEAPRIIE